MKHPGFVIVWIFLFFICVVNTETFSANTSYKATYALAAGKPAFITFVNNEDNAKKQDVVNKQQNISNQQAIEDKQDIPSKQAPLQTETVPFSKELKDAEKDDGLQLSKEVSPFSNKAYLFTSLVVLIGVCLLAYFVVRFLSRNSGFLAIRGKRLIRFVERLVLSPQKSLMIFQVAGRYYLVGVTEQGMSLLAELDQASIEHELEAVSQDGSSPSFSQYLANLGLKKGSQEKSGQSSIGGKHGEV